MRATIRAAAFLPGAFGLLYAPSPALAQPPICHQILPDVNAPTGYGVPWNPLSPKNEPLMVAHCNKTQALIDLGDGGWTRYIYYKAHGWSGESWQEKMLTAASGYDDPLPEPPGEDDYQDPPGTGTTGSGSTTGGTTGTTGGTMGLDLSKFIKKFEPQCLKTFIKKVKPAKIGGWNPPPNTLVDLRGLTIKFAPPGESGWNPSGSDNVCILGGRFIGQSSKLIGWEESKSKYDGSGIRVAHLNGAFIYENVYMDNSHDGVMLPRSLTPDGAKGIVRGSVFRYNRDDCIEADGNTSVDVDDSYFECNMFFSATHDTSAPRTLNVRNSLIHMKCMPDNRKKRVPCPGVSPRSATAVLWKGVGPNYRILMKDTIVYQEDRSKLGLSSMNLNKYGNVTYENVIVVWGGQGDWPTGPIPKGVTITKDESVWERAKAEWMRVHGCTSDASSCTFE